ncbi:MAG: alkaline phosphatase family protein [Acidobacteria bacterium]|nr:alkaline phosphatase family protein [Acidobacteriota bacterium]
MKLRRLQRALLPVYLIVCCTILPLRSFFESASSHTSSPPRRLVLVLDGVPYKTIADLRAEGRFRYFQEPARMISTFPSLTNPAMIEILQTEDSPGYEDHYYDRSRNRLLGNVQTRLQGGRFIHGTFRETFDYHAPAFKGAFAYVAAPFGAIALAQFDLSAFRSAFNKSKSSIFIGYIGETDTLAHLGGERALKSFLRTLDRTIEEFIAESKRGGGRLEVEMFSDHGNHYTEYRQVKLNDAIKQAGFITEKSLKSPQSVVLPKYGLVGSSMLFTAVENRSRLAEICAAVEGVDFAVYKSGDDVVELLSRRGHARMVREGDKYKYDDLGGDPLGLQDVIGAMKDSRVMDENGFASREDWWKATQPHRYVDPLRRLFEGFEKHVRNRADVIVSYEDGYQLGSPFLSIFARLRATHGNLLRGETEAFAMSTRQSLGGAVRGYELHRLFALDQRSKTESYFSDGGHCQLGKLLAMSVVRMHSIADCGLRIAD